MAVRRSAVVPLAVLVLGVVLVALAGSPLTSTAAASACTRWGDTGPERLSNGQARDAILCLVNDERRDGGLRSLERETRLQKAAQRHNDRMHGTGCFAHECPREPDLGRRLVSVGYLGEGLRRWAFGESIAWGLRDGGTPRAIVDAWMASAGHRANILSPTFREIGVGFSAGTPTRKRDPGGIYTIDLGLAVP